MLWDGEYGFSVGGVHQNLTASDIGQFDVGDGDRDLKRKGLGRHYIQGTFGYEF